jgi:transcriptional regulator with XRE-family HTH domain
VADQIQTVRLRKGWTQQELADRVTQLGMPMGRAVILKIERKRRHVTVDELVALSAALEVSPLFLLMPRDATSGDQIRVTPRQSLPIEMVTKWWHGAQELRFDDLGIEPDERIFDESRPGIHAMVAKQYPELELIWKWSIWTMAGLSGGTTGSTHAEETAVFATLMEVELASLNQRMSVFPEFREYADKIRGLRGRIVHVEDGQITHVVDQPKLNRETRQLRAKKGGNSA